MKRNKTRLAAVPCPQIYSSKGGIINENYKECYKRPCNIYDWIRYFNRNRFPLFCNAFRRRFADYSNQGKRYPGKCIGKSRTIQSSNNTEKYGSVFYIDMTDQLLRKVHPTENAPDSLIFRTDNTYTILTKE